MSHTETHRITLTKLAERSLQTKVIEKNITSLLAASNNKSLAVRGWTVGRSEEAATGQAWDRQIALDTEDYEYRYYMYLNATFTRDDDKQPEQTELASIVRSLNVKAGQPTFGKWNVTDVDGTEFAATNEDGDDITKFIEYAPVTLPDDWQDSFSHLYGLDSHIKIVKKAITSGITSEWRNRFHCALIGPPGCGKSEIASTFRDLLGVDAVWLLDGTAITQAGVIKELNEFQILPRVIVIEEIEKANEGALTFLLGLMDTRAEIRKTTARGNIQRDTRCFVIATVNDYKKFRTMNSGALGSRFANKIFFSRPTREVLAQILTREIEKDAGNDEWINPTLEYCDTHKITDPRRVLAICLTGREDLLTGEYQEMLRATGADVYEEGDEE